jgi:NodT family efflux transporter outer membrane factor (OMF) lipoprotein
MGGLFSALQLHGKLVFNASQLLKSSKNGGRPASRYLSAALALGLTGCTMVGPDFQTPEADVADSWLSTDRPEISGTPDDHGQWWKNFNDPTLDRLIETAYAQNLTLQLAGLRVYEARAVLGYASGTLYPQVQGLNGSASNINLSENSDPVSNLPPPVNSLVDTRFDRYAMSFDAAWELDFWGKFRRGVESADAHLAGTIATYDDILVTLSGEVATAYIVLRTLEQRLAYARNNVATQQRSLEIADVRFRNELVTELDVQLSRSLLQSTESTIPLLESSIDRTRLALSLLLGMPPSDLSDIINESGKIPDVPESVAVGIPADLLRRRPDIRRHEMQAAAQSARIGIAKADFYPALRLGGNIGWSAGSSSDLFDSGSGMSFAGVGFNWKILNYGRLRNNERVQDARFQQTILAYENSVLNAAREVEDGLARFSRSGERVEHLHKSVVAARRAVELAQTQYRDGIISYTLVLDSLQFLSLNEDLLAAARGEEARSLVSTYKALGGGWQMREGNDYISDDIRNTMQERTNWGELMEASSVVPVEASERGSWRLPDR